MAICVIVSCLLSANYLLVISPPTEHAISCSVSTEWSMKWNRNFFIFFLKLPLVQFNSWLPKLLERTVFWVCAWAHIRLSLWLYMCAHVCAFLRAMNSGYTYIIYILRPNDGIITREFNWVYVFVGVGVEAIPYSCWLNSLPTMRLERNFTCLSILCRLVLYFFRTSLSQLSLSHTTLHIPRRSCTATF